MQKYTISSELMPFLRKKCKRASDYYGDFMVNRYEFRVIPMRFSGFSVCGMKRMSYLCSVNRTKNLMFSV